jgi:peptidoglycan/LPS O-acetylase OafA/YrhL
MGAPWYLVIAGNIVAAFVSYRIVERPGMAIGRALLVKSAVPAFA